MKNGKLAAGIFSVLLFAALFFWGVSGGEPYDLTIVDGATDATVSIKVDAQSDTLLSELYKTENTAAAVYTADGDIIFGAPILNKRGSVTIGEQTVDLLHGIVTNPPGAMVTDVFTHAKSALDADGRVMILYLDGFGWDNYERAMAAGVIPNLAALSAQKAMAVFPTITPVNYAAMVTGQVPKITGVTARGIHYVECDTIFDYATARGLSSFIAEGNMQILTFSVEQELNIDFDGDGDTDNEVVQCAIDAIAAGNTDLLFVHLHGIDDTSHRTGPGSDETLDKIAQTDIWVGELMRAWNGRTIIVADHGQHENDGNGDAEYADKSGVHGAFAASDIFIPLLKNW